MPVLSRGIVGFLLLLILAACGYALLGAGIYGWTIFLLIPVFLGALVSWTFLPNAPAKAAGFGAISVLAALTMLLLVHIEGLICIVMALPWAMPLGMLGGWLAYRLNDAFRGRARLAALVLLPAATLGWDIQATPEVFEVRSQLEIAASPEQVWQHAVSFSEIPEPRDWFFRAGLAYPRRTRIEGKGTTATRYCEFSTGAFVEPIEVWDQPRLLRFRVTANPPPRPQAHSILGCRIPCGPLSVAKLF